MTTGLNKNLKSKYKYVEGRILSGNTYWIMRIIGETRQTHETERKAAIAADVYLINEGKEPVNILKRK